MKDDEFLTNAPKKEEFSIQSESYPNRKNTPGNSVNEHKNLEIANEYLAGKEIGQQRENN